MDLRRRLAARATILPALAVLAVLAAAPARADWLVTRDGARIETRGPWQQKGKLVVFTRTDGTLSSLRLQEVDLDASRRATEAEKVEAPAAGSSSAPAARPRRPSVLSLTDKDFKKSTPPPAPEGAAGADVAEPEVGAEAPADQVAPAADKDKPKLEVVSWERAEGVGEAVRLTGLLRNNSADQVTGAELVANLYDETGKLLARQKADLQQDHLGPGETTPFVVEVPGSYAFSAVNFQTRSTAFKLRVEPVGPGQEPPPQQ
jgi:hypothetical protein